MNSLFVEADWTNKWQNCLLGIKFRMLLVSGSKKKGAGKEKFGLIKMAKWRCVIICRELGLWESCKSCQLFNAGKLYFDLKMISTEDDVIKVAQIRQLSKRFNLWVLPVELSFAIIENAERWIRPLLMLCWKLWKNLANAVIILTTDDTGRLLLRLKVVVWKLILIFQRLISKKWLLDSTDFSWATNWTGSCYTNSTPLCDKTISWTWIIWKSVNRCWKSFSGSLMEQKHPWSYQKLVWRRVITKCSFICKSSYADYKN